ncbi:MAG: C10 family peptidase [Rikenellaceae bacterium]|nr:C10 family peptidase [Rikenellaceae bacterium]
MKKKSLLAAVITAMLFSCTKDLLENEIIGNDLPEQSESKTSFIKTEEEVIDEANYLRSLFNDGTTTKNLPGNYDVSVFKRALTKSLQNSNDTLFFIVNFENKSGFTFIPADRRIDAILAYSENGNLIDDSEENIFMDIVLEGMEQFIYAELAYLDSVGITDTKGRRGDEIESDGPGDRFYPITGPEKVEPLLTVNWNQGSPYNNLCPLKDGERANAGCVPIAVAQVMAYHKKPASYNGYNYDWNGMINGTNNSATARLVADVGNIMGTTYGWVEDGSSTEYTKAKYCFEVMGYKNVPSFTDYSIHRLLAPLRDGYPALVRGYSTRTNNFLGLIYSYSGGHMWVVDGFQAVQKDNPNRPNLGGSIVGQENTDTYDYLLHCVPGWFGDYNGYYNYLCFEFYDHSNGRTQKEYQYELKQLTNIEWL